MQIHFNKQEAGACPFCKKKKWCSIQSQIADALALIKNAKSQGVEAVIYACPSFDEEF